MLNIQQIKTIVVSQVCHRLIAAYKTIGKWDRIPIVQGQVDWKCIAEA